MPRIAFRSVVPGNAPDRAAGRRPPSAPSVPALARASTLELDLFAGAAPAWQLTCLHAGISPAVFGRCGLQALKRIEQLQPRAHVDRALHLSRFVAGVTEVPSTNTPEARLRDNLVEVAFALHTGRLRVVPGQDDGLPPLLCDVEVTAFKQWADQARLPSIGPWKESLDATSAWHQSLLARLRAFEAEMGAHDWLIVPVCNDNAQAVKRTFERNLTQYLAGGDAVPTCAEIVQQFKDMGEAEHVIRAALVNKMLKPEGLRPGRRRLALRRNRLANP